jgi:PAS domain S-box-containing protein
MNPLFKMLITQHKMEYIVLNENFCIQEISDEAAKFAYYPEEVIQGKDIRISFPEFVGAENDLTSLLAGRKTNWDLLGLERSLDSSHTMYLNVYVAPNQADGRKITSLIVLLQDATERMKLEQELKQEANDVKLLLNVLTVSKNYIDRIIESMADALIVTTRTGLIKKVNQTAQNLFGYTEKELIGKYISLIIPDEDLINQMSIEEMFIEGKLIRDIEILCKKKNGEDVPISFSCSAIGGENREGQKIVYVGRDITGRKRAETTLRHTNEELEQRIRERTQKLFESNEELKREIARRKKVEDALRKAHHELEKRVEARTAELLTANELLKQEIAERKRAEEQLEKAKGEAEAATHAKSEFLATIPSAHVKAKPNFDEKLSERFPLKILLAEDNIINQKLALRILQKMGYIVDLVGNGLEVLTALKEKSYDIIFMDVQMPKMDGLEATRRIIMDWPPAIRPKIIAMTANAIQGDREKCLEVGMDDYIAKPLVIGEIQRILEYWGRKS